jgi:hypothetical protein
MTFYAKPNSLLFGQNIMSHQNAVIYLGMTFYTSHVRKMQRLVRKPVVLFDDVDSIPIRQEMEPFKI